MLSSLMLSPKSVYYFLKFYDFQGYQIYQVKSGQVTVQDLDDPNLSRLAAQVDLKDGVMATKLESVIQRVEEGSQ